MYTCKTISSSKELKSALNQIDNINLNSIKCNIFTEVSWLSLWWDVYSKPEDRLCIPIIYNDSSPIAYAPFYLKDGKKMMWIGTGGLVETAICPEYIDIIHSKNTDKETVLSLFSTWLYKDINKIMEFEFHHSFRDSLIVDLMTNLRLNYATHVSDMGVQHKVDLGEGLDYYLHSITSKSFKKKARQFHQTIELDLGLNIEYLTKSDSAFVDKFYMMADMHTNIWRKKGKTGAFSTKAFKDLHLESFKNEAAPMENQVLCVLTLHDKVIGISYCLLSHEHCHYYQSGIHDDVHHSYSPGHLLHIAMMRYCCDNKIRYYDFMRGKTLGSYKDQYSASTREMVNITTYKASITTLPKIAVTIARNLKYNRLSA